MPAEAGSHSVICDPVRGGRLQPAVGRFSRSGLAQKRRGAHGGVAAVRDAVGDPDGAEAAAGQEQAGNRRDAPLDGGHAREMADLVLRALSRPAEQLG